MDIRRGNVGDANRIAKLELECFPEEPWTEKMIRESMEVGPNSFYLVALENEVVIGYVGIFIISPEGYISNVAVSPECRRRGIGEKLIEAILNEAKSMGANDVTLEVRVSNEPAIKLYNKLGFESVGLRKGYYQNNNEDAIIMWRRG